MPDPKPARWTEEQIARRYWRFAHVACPGTDEDEVDVCDRPDYCARNGCQDLARQMASRRDGADAD